MTELYIEDELPLPPFASVFGDIAGPTVKRRRKAVSASKIEQSLGDETTG
jgi:hypothetical protein